MKPNSLQELYVEQLKDLYDTEQQIIKALPEMIEAASSSQLKAALQEHLKITKTQATPARSSKNFGPRRRVAPATGGRRSSEI